MVNLLESCDIMTTVFVYPTQNYSQNGIVLEHSFRDGYCYEASVQGIKNFLKEERFDIKDIEWKVRAHPDDLEFAVIVAETPAEFISKFKALDVIYEKRR